MTQYIIFAILPRGKGVENRVIEGATSIKGARQKAYRAAKRYPEANYIGIQTITKYHQPYSKTTVKVKMGEDGKVYANKKVLKSTGEFYTDKKKTQSEDIFAWYKGETKTKSKVPRSVPKEQPANLMSSKFMRDHIIIARPKPVSRAPTGFTWQVFNERFNHYYKEMYEGRLDMSREWVEKGDRILQTKKEFVNNFVAYRRDIISSDRETAALARTYDYFQKKGMIKGESKPIQAKTKAVSTPVSQPPRYQHYIEFEDVSKESKWSKKYRTVKEMYAGAYDIVMKNLKKGDAVTLTPFKDGDWIRPATIIGYNFAYKTAVVYIKGRTTQMFQLYPDGHIKKLN